MKLRPSCSHTGMPRVSDACCMCGQLKSPAPSDDGAVVQHCAPSTQPVELATGADINPLAGQAPSLQAPRFVDLGGIRVSCATHVAVFLRCYAFIQRRLTSTRRRTASICSARTLATLSSRSTNEFAFGLQPHPIAEPGFLGMPSSLATAAIASSALPNGLQSGQSRALRRHLRYTHATTP